MISLFGRFVRLELILLYGGETLMYFGVVHALVSAGTEAERPVSSGLAPTLLAAPSPSARASRPVPRPADGQRTGQTQTSRRSGATPPLASSVAHGKGRGRHKSAAQTTDARPSVCTRHPPFRRQPRAEMQNRASVRSPTTLGKSSVVPLTRLNSRKEATGRRR
jgi:hypothetical protein